MSGKYVDTVTGKTYKTKVGATLDIGIQELLDTPYFTIISLIPLPDRLRSRFLTDMISAGYNIDRRMVEINR